MDDKQRKCNLIISGLEENQNENEEQCLKKVDKLITDKLKIDTSNTAKAYRVGHNNNKGHRDIMVKFRNQFERDRVFRKKPQLKGQNI